MIIIVPLLFSIINIAFRGIIIHFFWRWFIVTQFVNVDQLSVIGCIGLSVFLDVITPRQRLSEDELKEDVQITVHRDMNNSFYYSIGLLLSFGLGWLITFCM